jgi:hypothetical protein
MNWKKQLRDEFNSIPVPGEKKYKRRPPVRYWVSTAAMIALIAVLGAVFVNSGIFGRFVDNIDTLKDPLQTPKDPPTFAPSPANSPSPTDAAVTPTNSPGGIIVSGQLEESAELYDKYYYIGLGNMGMGGSRYATYVGADGQLAALKLCSDGTETVELHHYDGNYVLDKKTYNLDLWYVVEDGWIVPLKLPSELADALEYDSSSTNPIKTHSTDYVFAVGYDGELLILVLKSYIAYNLTDYANPGGTWRLSADQSALYSQYDQGIQRRDFSFDADFNLTVNVNKIELPEFEYFQLYGDDIVWLANSDQERGGIDYENSYLYDLKAKKIYAEHILPPDTRDTRDLVVLNRALLRWIDCQLYTEGASGWETTDITPESFEPKTCGIYGLDDPYAKIINARFVSFMDEQLENLSVYDIVNKRFALENAYALGAAIWLTEDMIAVPVTSGVGGWSVYKFK